MQAAAAPERPAAEVRDSTALDQALRNARGGEVLRLSGAHFGRLVLEDRRFSPSITITSAQAAQPARFESISLTKVSGVRIERVSIEVAAKGAGAAVLDSSNVRLSALSIHGRGVAAGGLGVMIRNSQHIELSRSEISGLWGGVNHLDDRDLVIADNRLHDLEEDAIRGGGSSQVTVAGNEISDLYPAAGDHPDAIQFWGTSDHPKVEDLRIENNFYRRGHGRAAQGVFVADGGYTRLTVRRNAVIGGLYNGILVSGAESAVIENNLVAGLADNPSWVGVAESRNVTVVGNVSSGGVVETRPNRALVKRDNTSIAPSLTEDPTVVVRWRATHPR